MKSTGFTLSGMPISGDFCPLFQQRSALAFGDNFRQNKTPEAKPQSKVCARAYRKLRRF
jgi:hypothetical protein